MTYYLITFIQALHGPHLDKLGLNDSNESDDDGADESLDEEAFRDALGTRPPLPGSVDLDETYRKVLEIFFLTTNEAPEKRPSAREILDLLDQVGNGISARNMPRFNNEYSGIR